MRKTFITNPIEPRTVLKLHLLEGKAIVETGVSQIYNRCRNADCAEAMAKSKRVITDLCKHRARFECNVCKGRTSSKAIILNARQPARKTNGAQNWASLKSRYEQLKSRIHIKVDTRHRTLGERKVADLIN
jgi:hypothetical protein